MEKHSVTEVLIESTGMGEGPSMNGKHRISLKKSGGKEAVMPACFCLRVSGW